MTNTLFRRSQTVSPSREARPTIRWERWIGPAWLWALLLLTIVIGFIASPHFLTVTNFSNILQHASPLIILATGQTFALLVAGVDISVASTISMGTTLLMMIVDGHASRLPLALLAVLAASIAVGLLNGIAVTVLRVPAFIVTYGVASIVQGIVFMYTNQVNVGAPAHIMTQWGYKTWGPVPFLAVYAAVIVLISLVLQNRTRFGRWAYAVGGSDEVARLAGIPVRRVRVIAYVICALSAALASIVVSLRTGSGDPLGGSGFDWDSIAAVVIGGTALSGGRGGVAGSVLGALLLIILGNIMNIVGVSSFWQIVVQGAVVLLAVTVSTVQTRRAQRLARTNIATASSKPRLLLPRGARA
jgi:ribose transport system permease protein